MESNCTFNLFYLQTNFCIVIKRLCPQKHEMSIKKLTNYFPLCSECHKLLQHQCYSCEICNLILCLKCYKKLPISEIRKNAKSKYLTQIKTQSQCHYQCKKAQLPTTPDKTAHSLNEFIWQKLQKQPPSKYLMDGSQHIKHLENNFLSIFYNTKSGTQPIDQDLIKSLKQNKQIIREKIPLNQYRIRIKQLLSSYIQSGGINNILILGIFQKLAHIYDLPESIFYPCKGLKEYQLNQEIIDHKVQQLADLERRKEEKNLAKFYSSFSENTNSSFYPTSSLKYKKMNLSYHKHT